jgi:LuxR family transcriptional regulator, maltose regulon positive regulatory protein
MQNLALPFVSVSKLAIPRTHPEAIVRERVTGLLDDASSDPLTVVCAPAGWGKTTAVVQWLGTLPCPRAWLSLDTLDNDPRRLCAHLAAALDRIWPTAMAEVQRALLGGSDLTETIVPLICLTVAEQTSGQDDVGLVIVLDDYQLIDSPICDQLIGALIDGVPPAVRIVVVSRTQPRLRLARRRALGTVADVDAPQLLFDDAETERLLNGSLAVGLDVGQLATVHQSVEGWPAGLGLVATALRQSGDRTHTTAILARLARSRAVEYLIEEVFEHQTPQMRAFLGRTSILERLDPGVCEAVLGDPSARELLTEVRRSNLFVTPLCADHDDQGGDWVRYHPLFAELLSRQLRNDAPELIPTLHRRAAEWYAANGLPEDAIHHATAAGDGPRAAELVRDSWRALFDERRYKTLRQLIARLPADRGELGPLCDAIEIRCMGLDDVDLRLVAQHIDALERHHDAPGVAPILDHMRVSPYYGDVGRAVCDGWTAWRRYRHPSIRRELVGNLAVVLWYAGDRHAVRDVTEPYLSAINQSRTLGWALAALALSAADDNELELAEDYARQAVDVIDSHGATGALESHFAYVARAESLRLRGQLDHARSYLDRAAHLTGRRPGSPFQAITVVFDAQLSLTADDRLRARTSSHAARRIIARYPDLGVLETRLESIEATLAKTRSDALFGSQPTRGEQRVLALLPGDLSTTQIAGRLYLSPETVRSHIRRLYRRLGAHNRLQAIQIAQQRGLLRTEGPRTLPLGPEAEQSSADTTSLAG